MITLPAPLRRRIVLVCTSLGVFLLACNRSKTPPAEGPPAADAMAGMEGMAGMASVGDTSVLLDRTAAARLGITFARATRAEVRTHIEFAGVLKYAEPRREYVSARVRGWVEQLMADYVGKPVTKGDPLLAFYAPELVNAQEELLAARRLGDSALTAGARRRLELWNIPRDQIQQLERTGEVRRTLILRAPRSGEIAEKFVSDGQSVQPGDNLFLVADRDVVWLEAAVFERDAPLVRIGSTVEARLTALPGTSYPGRVVFIEPSLDPKSRTLTARIELINRGGRLRPGMYATVAVARTGLPAVTVPLEAVLPTGRSNLVFVHQGDGRFVPRDVTLGARGDSLIEVTSGLAEGDEVVASATYLLDSETNLSAAMQGLMLRMGMGLDMGGMAAPGSTPAPPPAGAMPGMKMDAPRGGKP